MKDYKRLTERDDSLCIDCADIGFCRKTCISQARYERLQFLENEIESREIDYVADRNKQIARLTAENAELRATLSKMETVEKELRERLEKAVELPRIIHPNEYEWFVQYQNKYGLIFDEIFYSERAAEARLKEIKENNND